MNIITPCKTYRNERASSIVEVVAIVIIMIPLCLFAFNIAFLAFGNFFNDAAGREAARAAAEQPSEALARAAATNAVKSYNFAGGLFGTPTITTFQYNFKLKPLPPGNSIPAPVPTPFQVVDLKPGIVDPALAGAGTGGEAPNVLVVTQMTCQTPIPMIFGPKGLANRVTVQSIYRFPLLQGIKDTTTDTDDDDFAPPDDNALGDPEANDPDTDPADPNLDLTNQGNPDDPDLPDPTPTADPGNPDPDPPDEPGESPDEPVPGT